jgi:NitT/TauT family transport system substrate-binding protein
MKRLSWLAAGVILCLILTAQAWSVQKVKFSTSVKPYAVFYLPSLAAEEKGIWQKNGLEGTWVPFRGGGNWIRALAAGEIKIGLGSVAATAQGSSRGVSLVAVRNLYAQEPFFVYVRSDGSVKSPKDLEGKKIGINRRGAIQDAYAQVVTKVFGLGKNVRIVATGGIGETVAALKTKSIDALVLTPWQMIKLEIEGQVQRLVPISDHLPKDWIDMAVIAHKSFLTDDPAQVKKIVRVVSQSIDAIANDPDWTINKMKEMSGFSDEAARKMYKELNFSKDGRIERKAVESVRSFLIQYGIVNAQKVPPTEKLFTNQFLE